MVIERPPTRTGRLVTADDTLNEPRSGYELSRCTDCGHKAIKHWRGTCHSCFTCVNSGGIMATHPFHHDANVILLCFGCDYQTYDFDPTGYPVECPECGSSRFGIHERCACNGYLIT